MSLVTWRFYAHVHRPLGGSKQVSVLIERGATLKPVLDRIAEQGVLSRPRWLYFYARLTGATEIRAGEYEITAEQSPAEILVVLHEGRLKMEQFTLSEGLNRWQVRDLLADKEWIQADHFDRLCDDTTFLKSNAIPGPTCDGYLYPETYTFARGVAAKKILAEMFRSHNSVYADVTKRGRGPMSLGHRELVTLASIVEKETSDSAERPHIACVFYNRLTATPMWRLDTDPTVIYAAMLQDPTFDGNLKRKHLRQLSSPYNTYKVTGLPPGPIANPGRFALEAVVDPGRCNDFFFVSMNNGRHVFCPTLDCHNKAVQKWQIDYFRRR